MYAELKLRAAGKRMSINTARRSPGILPLDTVLDCRGDGTVYARSPFALGAYPDRITERLEHWAVHAPDRTFLAERDDRGEWRRVTYADALRRVRIACAGAPRPSAGRSAAAGHPLWQQHRARTARARSDVPADLPYAPLAPSYSLVRPRLHDPSRHLVVARPGNRFCGRRPGIRARTRGGGRLAHTADHLHPGGVAGLAVVCGAGADA